MPPAAARISTHPSLHGTAEAGIGSAGRLPEYRDTMERTFSEMGRAIAARAEWEPLWVVPPEAG
jgi:hypothetical protein